MTLKEQFKPLPHILATPILHGPKFQHIAAVFIAYRQGLTATGSGSPPAFKIYRPHFVNCLGSSAATQSAPFEHYSTALALLAQPSSLENSLKATLAGHLSMLT